MSEREIFTAARRFTNSVARSAYLDRTCGGDSGLRTRVEALLRADDHPDSLLDQPAVARLAPDCATDRTVDQPVDAAAPEVALRFLAPATRSDSLGRIGHYEALQVLGRGGFGIVFRGFDDVLHRVVAVKVLSPQMAATSPARKRFLREARSSAQVRHENVVQVYEVGEQPLPYIAMEFIPGETLQQRVDRLGPFEPAEVLRVGRQIAEGLAAAHACDLIHRDIKPGNILLEGGSHKVKITDFGLARTADDANISQSGLIVGTPMYMAPEQALGQKIDQRADLFSLGSVLYQMASGRPPFRAPSTLAVLKRVAEEKPRPVSEIIPETPDWLCRIIAKLHAKNPGDRYQSAREVADVLADCEAQLKANAKLKDLSRIPRGESRSSGRRKWVAAAAILLLPVLALAATELAGVTHLFRPPHASTGPQTPAPPGRSRTYALAFDGKRARVEIPDLKYDGTHPITVEAWVKVAPSNAALSSFLSNNGISLGTCLQPNLPWNGWVRMRPGKDHPGGLIFLWSDDPHQVDRWTHVAGVYADNSWTQFINGLRQKVAPTLVDHLPSDESFFLGGHMHEGEFLTPFQGQLREVRFSRVARYEKDFTPAARFDPDPDTLGLYHMDEGTGDVLRDSAANGRHGKVIGAKWVELDVSHDSSPVPVKKQAPSDDPDRRAADYVLSIGGIVNVNGQDQQIKTRADLPREIFSLTGVWLQRNKRVSDAGLAHFKDCKNLVHLELHSNSQLTDAGVAHFRNCKSLTHLALSGTQVSDVGAAYFKDCKDLTFLNLEGTQVRDAGLACFKDCKDLDDLRLSGTQVGDAGLAHFKDCKSLTHLFLYRTQMTDAGLAHFKDCKNLLYLWLDNAQLSDASLVNLKEYRNLKRLWLNTTQVSDAGLAQLKDCKSLDTLWLQGTQVSDAGLAHLKDCKDLKTLWLEGSKVSGLAPLMEMRLEAIYLTPANITPEGIAILRAMNSLKTIGVSENQVWPTAEFWERYDKGEFR